MRLRGSIIIARHGRRFIMVKHGERSWEFPGGHIEGNETPLAAAKRELIEETGLTGTKWHDCGIAKLENGNLAIFSCSVCGRPDPRTHEIEEARYFTGLPMDLSFRRHEYHQLLDMAGYGPKPKTDYDTASIDFDNIRSRNPLHLDDWTNGLIRWGRITNESRVLDAGCGTGRYSLEIGKRTGAKVVGTDYSRGMLGQACRKEVGRWLQSDIARLPFGDRAFDTVIIMLVLQHVDDVPLAISEANRVLKNGGQLVIVTVSHARIRRHIMRHFPGAVQIDLDRFMPVPEMKWHLANQDFVRIHHHIVQSEPTESTIEQTLQRFRKRYISTLALVPEKDFEKNMEIFEKALREHHGQTIENTVELVFIEARKN